MSKARNYAVGGLLAAYLLSQRGEVDSGDGNGTTEPKESFTSGGVYGTSPPVDITIRQSVSLTEANGRAPERENAKVFVEAMKAAEYDYNVRIGFDPVESPSQIANCADGNLKAFKDKMDTGDYGYVANDANILLLNTNSGGCGYITGKYAVVNGADVTERREYREAGPRTDGQIQAHYAFMHEAGHNLGASHKSPDAFADAWTDSRGRFHKTPNYGGKTTNECGQELPAQHDPVILHLTYSDCTLKHWVVR